MSENSRGLRAAPDLALNDRSLGGTAALLQNGDERLANAVSLVQGPDRRLYYRIAMAPATGAVSREQRFAGQVQQLDGTYIDAGTGAKASLSDAELTRHFAARFFKINEESIAAGRKISQFGMDYDFRNKRLPVWQFEHEGIVVFVDPASSTVVDVVTPGLRYESWSFSILHKWNVLVPFLGRGGRDLLLSVILCSTILLAGVGLLMRLQRRGA